MSATVIWNMQSPHFLLSAKRLLRALLFLIVSLILWHESSVPAYAEWRFLPSDPLDQSEAVISLGYGFAYNESSRFPQNSHGFAVRGEVGATDRFFAALTLPMAYDVQGPNERFGFSTMSLELGFDVLEEKDDEVVLSLIPTARYDFPTADNRLGRPIEDVLALGGTFTAASNQWRVRFFGAYYRLLDPPPIIPGDDYWGLQTELGLRLFEDSESQFGIAALISAAWLALGSPTATSQFSSSVNPGFEIFYGNTSLAIRFPFWVFPDPFEDAPFSMSLIASHRFD